MIITEQDSPYNNLEKMTFLEIINSINNEDQKIAKAVKKNKKRNLFTIAKSF